MARAHDTTLACFDRAEAAPEVPGAREVELRLAARFMALFMQQAVALERRRAQAHQAEEAARRAAFKRDRARTEAMIGGMEGFPKHAAEPRGAAREASAAALPGDAATATPSAPEAP